MGLFLISSWTAFLLLGVVQGATEFLPVSSSGHLKLVEGLLGFSPDKNFGREIALHVGTLAAVMIYCREDLKRMARSLTDFRWRLMLGTAIVTGGVAFASRGLIAQYFAGPETVGWGLLVTAVFLGVFCQRNDRLLTRGLSDLASRDLLVLGLLQSVALVPGISRMGACLAGAMLLGFNRQESARISFLMSVPAVGGAALVQWISPGDDFTGWEPHLILGMVVAGIVGLLALRFLHAHVDARSLRGLAAYCLVVAVFAMLTV